MLNATDIFQTDFFENVTAIEYYGFDETTVTFTDTDKINDTLNLLKNAQYQLVESEDFIEGLYMFDFIMGEENVSIGIGLHEISIGGNQYRTEDNLSDEIINILEITLEWSISIREYFAFKR